LPAEQWRTLLTEAVSGGQLSLVFYPVVSGSKGTANTLHQEGVIRLSVAGQPLMPAGDFMPMAAKLNLALAAGLALPLLEWLGYQPGAANASGLQALSLAYAVLPCAIKSLAALGLYLAFVRPLRLSGPALSKPEESP